MTACGARAGKNRSGAERAEHTENLCVVSFLGGYVSAKCAWFPKGKGPRFARLHKAEPYATKGGLLVYTPGMRFASRLTALLLPVLLFAYPRVFPTGVTLYDPARAYNTFVFFATQEDGPGQSFLIDMNGNEVHHWTHGGMP